MSLKILSPIKRIVPNESAPAARLVHERIPRRNEPRFLRQKNAEKSGERVATVSWFRKLRGFGFFVSKVSTVDFRGGRASGGVKWNESVLFVYMGVSKNNGTTKSSILIRFSIINHPFWGTPIFGNAHMLLVIVMSSSEVQVEQ